MVRDGPTKEMIGRTFLKAMYGMDIHIKEIMQNKICVYFTECSLEKFVHERR